MVREQRSGMVQTEAQYKFIYLAVSEHIQATKAKENASKVSRSGRRLSAEEKTRISYPTQWEFTFYLLSCEVLIYLLGKQDHVPRNLRVQGHGDLHVNRPLHF